MNDADTTKIGDCERSASKAKYMMPHRGRGKELVDLFRKELGIHEGVKEFEVRFSAADVVTVRCTYMPQEHQ